MPWQLARIYPCVDLPFSRLVLVWLTILSAAPRPGALADSPLDQSLAAIRSVGKEGSGFPAAILAAERLRSTPADQVTLLLDGMAGTNPVAENWLRGVVFDVVRTAEEPPLDLLTGYVTDQSRNPLGRSLAMELIRRQSPETASALIRDCLHDPALPIREMAVEQAIEEARQMAKEFPERSKARYREALAAARHPVQLEGIVTALRDLGVTDVSIAESFAMVARWQSLAPLNNVDGVGYETAYAPELEFAARGLVDLDADHEGKAGLIRWRDIVGSPDSGKVDLAAAYDKEKGAVCYLFTEFESSQARPAIARLGCINANKVWINGKLVMANEVYHSGSTIDQYSADFPLQQGTNRILLKICQNEQTESWAQEWEFQFRITDATGKALRSGD